MMFRELEEKAGKVSNVLLKQEKWHTITLKQKKELFVKKFPVYTHQNGKLVLLLFRMTEYSEDDLDSFATISTCSGQKGILTLDGTVFGIRPIYIEHIWFTAYL